MFPRDGGDEDTDMVEARVDVFVGSECVYPSSREMHTTQKRC